MASILDKVTQGVQKLTSHTLTEASKVKEKILNDGQTHDETVTFTSLWEIPELIEFCRGCEAKFTTRKHHCRSCAGVFCDDCAPSNIPSSTFEEELIPKSLNLAPGSPVRICNGCKRGECPSRDLIETIRGVLDAQLRQAESQGGSEKNALERIQHKMAMKVNEAVGKLGEEDGRALNVFQYRMHRGSFWGEDGLVRKAGGRPPPVSGYFELHNKSGEVVALKLVKDTGSALFEAARPSYISVPPGDTVYTFFGPDIQALQLIVLCGNPHALPQDRAILYDTRAHGANPLRLSPCARVFEHPRCLVYRSGCHGRNVVLKYKGAGEVLARRGNGVGRVGVLGWMAGRRFAPDLPDLNSNVAAVALEHRFEAHAHAHKAGDKPRS